MDKVTRFFRAHSAGPIRRFKAVVEAYLKMIFTDIYALT